MPEEAQDVQPLDIDKYLGNVQNRIKEIGIELEGGWAKFPTNERLVTDTSVFKDPTELDRQKIRDLKISRIGEMPSSPMIPIHMGVWMKKNYPTYVNHTCGLHVHMSFESLRNYVRLMTPVYQLTMLVYLKKWANEVGLGEKHPIWDRLSGKSEYCNHNFFADKQVLDRQKDYDHFREGNRYTAIAYRFGKHRTIECRVLPMMETPELGISGIRRVLDITNACLVKLADREVELKEEIYGPTAEGIIERDVEEL